MTNLSKILEDFFGDNSTEDLDEYLNEFHQEILLACIGKSSLVILDKDVKNAIEKFDGSVEELEEYLYCVCVPGGMEAAEASSVKNTVRLRRKRYINSFWKKQRTIDLIGCTVTLVEKTKVYSRDGATVAAAFGNGQSGQFGEFSSPLIDRNILNIIYSYTNKGAVPPKKFGSGDITKISEFIKEIPLDHHFVIKIDDVFVEIPPLNMFGVKLVPITSGETDKGVKANHGTFSSEIIANNQYERLVTEGCAFTPLFSKGTIIDFNIKMFSSENIITVNRLQKTLRSIKREADILKKFPNSPVSWNIINDNGLESSLFSDKIGLFVTTTVGDAITDPPLIDTEELISLIVDALWTIEQALANKIYLTDLNIGNILYYDMKPIAAMCGYQTGVKTTREYSWNDSQSKHNTFRMLNTYSRLVFVDLGTSFIEKPSFGNKKVIDMSSPMTKESRLELRASCRGDVLATIMYCIVVNGSDAALMETINNLNLGKNLFLQFIETMDNIPDIKEYEVSEKYSAKVFR